jgi:hypothetical protein
MTNLYVISQPKFDLAAEDRKREEARERARKCWAVIDQIRPAKACAVIIAELEEDTSDPMSDYYGSKTTRRVAIGWRTGKREDFRQLRRAAAGYAPTAHLGPGCGDFRVVALWRGESHETNGRYLRDGEYMPVYELHGKHFATRAGAESAIAGASDAHHRYENGRVEYVIEGSEKCLEHRDNWSMGHGNWVGRDKHSGWQVRSFDLDYKSYRSDSLILWLPGLKGAL